MVYGAKEHHPSYLIGRLVRKKQLKQKSSGTSRIVSVPVPDFDYAKIRAELQKEMDEKLEKRLSEMMQKLAEKNPELNINLDESEKLTSDFDESE